MICPPRVRLAQLPTPIEKLDRLTHHLGGPEIYVKRDDQTGLATGGNKARKLEFLMAEALAQKCNHVVSVGGPQSNLCGRRRRPRREWDSTVRLSCAENLRRKESVTFSSTNCWAPKCTSRASGLSMRSPLRS